MFWILIEKILRIFYELFVVVAIARYLGPIEFGLYSYIFSIFIIFSIFLKLGIETVLIKNIIEDKKNSFNYLYSSLFLRISASSIFILISYLFLNEIEFKDSIYYLIFFTAIFFQSSEVFDYYFQAFEKFKTISIIKIVQLLVSSLIKIYLIYSKASLFLFILSFSFDYLLLFLLYIITFGIKFQFPSILFDRFFLDAKKIIKDSYPLMISALVVTIYMRIDQIMINYFQNTKDVGIYSAAVKIAESWYFIPMVISQFYYPKLIKNFNSSKEEFEQNLINQFRFMSILSLLSIFFFFIFSEKTIYLLFGEEYNLSSEPLIILVMSGLFVSSGVISSKWFVIMGLQKYTMYRTFIGCLINILLNLILIPQFSYVGAAYATLISQSFATLFSNYFFINTKEIFFIQLRGLLFWK